MICAGDARKKEQKVGAKIVIMHRQMQDLETLLDLRKDEGRTRIDEEVIIETIDIHQHTIDEKSAVTDEMTAVYDEMTAVIDETIAVIEEKSAVNDDLNEMTTVKEPAYVYAMPTS